MADRIARHGKNLNLFRMLHGVQIFALPLQKQGNFLRRKDSKFNRIIARFQKIVHLFLLFLPPEFFLNEKPILPLFKLIYRG